jgi:serine protease Do
MAPPKKTLYQILGVPRDASDVDIGLAYEMRSAEMQHAVPPDPSGVSLVRDAHRILSDPVRRAAYDASLASAAEKAAAQAQAQADTDAGIEEEAPAPRKVPAWALAAAAVVVVIAVGLMMRPSQKEAPAEAPVAVAEAPKPAPAAPPPKERTGTEILADASASSGQLLAISMSGRSRPIGVALGTGPGTMVTTCHGIPAGDKLVVRVGKDQYPAELSVTDEQLDICRLSVAGYNVPPFRTSPDMPRAGDRIFSVGMNAGGEMAATEGTVKRLVKTPLGDVLEISVPVAPTASGGGVFDLQGRLVGIATTPHKFGAGLAIALPVSWLSEARSRTQ